MSGDEAIPLRILDERRRTAPPPPRQNDPMNVDLEEVRRTGGEEEAEAADVVILATARGAHSPFRSRSPTKASVSRSPTRSASAPPTDPYLTIDIESPTKITRSRQGMVRLNPSISPAKAASTPFTANRIGKWSANAVGSHREGGGGQQGEEERRSPVRRSQTLNADVSHVALPMHGPEPRPAANKKEGEKAVKVGEQYQLAEDALPPCPVGGQVREPLASDIARVAAQFLAWSVADAEEAKAEAFERALDRGVQEGRITGEGREAGWLLLKAYPEQALLMAEDVSRQVEWSKEEKILFVEGMNEYDKNFGRIKELIPKRSVKEVIAYFYMWKQTEEYKEWKINRPMQYVEQVIPDYHAEVCDECERPGDLLCCDTCNLAFHMSCIGLAEPDIPDDFSCQKCLEQYNEPAKREKAKRMVQTKVKKVMQARDKELLKLEQELPGYIARSRPKVKAARKKRKRDDVAEDEGEAQPVTTTAVKVRIVPTTRASAAGRLPGAEEMLVQQEEGMVEGKSIWIEGGNREAAKRAGGYSEENKCPPSLLGRGAQQQGSGVGGAPPAYHLVTAFGGSRNPANGRSGSVGGGAEEIIAATSSASSVSSQGSSSEHTGAASDPEANAGRRGPYRTVKMAC